MRVQANGASFFVEESGAGTPAAPAAPTLVFLHHFGGSSQSWCEVTARLASTCRCLAPDLRGFGDSQATEHGYSVGESADDVLALLQVLEVRDFVLVGHSMGGKIALEVAARQPKYLRAVVLLAPSPPTPEPMEDAVRARLASTWAQRDAVRETIDKITARPLPPQVLARAIQDGARSSRPAWMAWLESGSREDISPRMSRVQVPATVVAGACDEAMTPQVLEREVVARVMKSRLIVVPESGHLVPLEAPQFVADLVRQTAPQDEPRRL
jgi:pimeloyl-ACP methyl ester carboxylesterase